MSAGFFKRNEKVLLTLLLLILAPMFAFTGIMTWYFTQGRKVGAGVYSIHGRVYSQMEFSESREELSDIRRVYAARSYGPFYDPGRTGASEVDTLDYLVRLHTLDELGLRLAGGQEQEALRNAAIDLLTWYRVMRDRNWMGGQDAQMAYFAERQGATFNLDEYRRAVAEPRLGLDMTVQEFEDSVRAGARLGLLEQLISSIPAVSTKELYDEYCLDRQKRHFEYVRVSSDRFLDAAREQVDEAYIRSVYDENPNIYRKDAALDLRVAIAPRRNFIDPEFDPGIPAIEERYERDKTTRYKVFRAADWVPPEGHDPESDYRPLPEVFELVLQSLKEDAAREVEQSVLQAAIARARSLDDAGSDWKLEDLFPPEHQDKIEYTETGWFTRAEVNTLPVEIRNAAVLNGLFSAVELMSVGDVGEAPVAVTGGSYIYRVKGIERARPQSFEEAIAKVTENAERRRARELAGEYLAGWVDRIRSEPETTLATVAAEENTTVYSTEQPLAQYEGYLLRIDGKQVPAGSQLAQAVFRDCNEIGDVTEPVIAQTDDNVHLAELREIVLPDMTQWETARPSLESKILQRRTTAIRSQFAAEMERRAEVTPLFEAEERKVEGVETGAGTN